MLSCWEEDESMCSILDRDGGPICLWDGHYPLRYQRKVSKKKLRESSYAFASSLIKKFGIGRGEPIAIILPNVPEFIFAYFGIWLAGSMAAPLNARLNKYEFASIIKSAEIKRVVVLDKFYPEIADIETLENIIVVRMSKSLPFIKGLVYISKAKKQKIFVGIPEHDKRVVDFKELLKNGKKNPSLYFPQLKPESAALMLFTSGTTGMPKGVVHTHKSLMENAKACKKLLAELLGKDNFKNEVFLAAAPYFHIMGLSTMLHLPLLVGSKIMVTFPFPNEDFGDKLLNAVSYAKVSIFVGAPRFYEMMLVSFQKGLKWKKSDFSSLKLCISGSVEMPNAIRVRFKKTFDTDILEGYGMSEAGITHCQKAEFNFVGSVGVPLSGVEQKLIDIDKERVGEILVRSRGLMKGYTDRAADEVFIDENGWLHTGDLGEIAKNGELFLTGRKKDLIKIDGEGIHPAQIEQVLRSYYLVKETAVVGKKIEGREVVVAFVVLKDFFDIKSKEEIKEELFQLCRSKLSSIKVPKEINFVSELPKNIFGKVLKKDLK